MRVVPELVFVNCCHLAARNSEQLLQTQGERDYDRAIFASGVAEQLIKIGVRCVIAAGWAVEDGPAMTFAKAFYGALLQGQRFIDAVYAARKAAREQAERAARRGLPTSATAIPTGCSAGTWAMRKCRLRRAGTSSPTWRRRLH